MKKDTANGTVKILGIDLAKQSFQLHGVDEASQTVLRKKLSRSQVCAFVARMEPCLIGLEACGGSHYWARVFKSYGHTVRIIAPQFVKPYVKSNKNDAVDAEAICEAVQRPNMRFVPDKSVGQQDMQSLHRIRSQIVSRRTAQANQVRGLLMEYGIVIPQGIRHLRQQIPRILEDADNGLSDLFRQLLNELYQEFVHLDERLESLESTLKGLCVQSEDCRRLLTIPGVGLLTATALVAAVGDICAFKSGRELAAWLGLVPRQHSTGGKTALMGISKRGDSYLRKLLVHGARAVIRHAKDRDDGLSQWLNELVARKHVNVATVALANKTARIAWAIVHNETSYDPMLAASGQAG
jgi:transposase